MRIVFIWLICAASMGAETIKGRLINGTSGGDGSAEMVQLLRLEGGMQVEASLANVTGAFELQMEGDPSHDRYLLQAIKGRTRYSLTIEAIDKTLEIEVFDQAETAEIKPSVSSMAMYAHGENLEIGIFYNIDNTSNPPVTLDRPDSTFSFPLIPGYKSIEASTTRGSMPLRQNLDIRDGTAALNYPLRPGRTQLLVRNAFAYDPGKVNEIALPLLDAQEAMHVLVLPSSLDLEADGLVYVSTDSEKGLKLYEWTRQPEQNLLALTISGAAAPPEQATQTESQEANPNHDIENTPNLLHPYRWWIVGLAVFLFLSIAVASTRSPHPG